MKLKSNEKKMMNLVFITHKNIVGFYKKKGRVDMLKPLKERFYFNFISAIIENKITPKYPNAKDELKYWTEVYLENETELKKRGKYLKH
jgi:hypothetical protein